MDVRNSRPGVRRVSSALAAFLALGALATALPFTGLAKAISSATGYAFLGYSSTSCGEGHAQTIDGDVVHVCQTKAPTVTAQFAGHRAFPIEVAGPELVLGLPGGTPHVYAVCCDYGLQDFTTGSLLAPVGLTDTVTYSAMTSPSTVAADITQVANVSPSTQSGYTVTYTITNMTAAPLEIVPNVVVPYYGSFEDTPSIGHAFSPNSLTMSSPTEGGSAAITATSPDATSWEGGQYSDVNSRINTTTIALSDSVTASPGGSVIALQWGNHAAAGTALAAHGTAGDTATYTVTIALTPTRELDLALHSPGVVPSVGAPTLVDATAIDDRGVSGQTVRWTTFDSSGRTGTATLDASGHATLAIPSLPAGGPTSLDVWVDRNHNGIEDTGEEGSGGFIWIPRVVTPPSSPPVTLPVQPPVVTPVHIVLTRFGVKLGALGTLSLKKVKKSGVRLSLTVDRAGHVVWTLTIPNAIARKLHLTRHKSKAPFVLGHVSATALKAGLASGTLKLSAKTLKRLHGHTVHLTLQIVVTGTAGLPTTKTVSVTIKG